MMFSKINKKKVQTSANNIYGSLIKQCKCYNMINKKVTFCIAKVKDK